MKLLFLPTQRKFTYKIDGEDINDIPLSDIQDGESFSLPEMREAGIQKAERINGELLITLEQCCIAYRYPVASHDWRESEWIDSTKFNSNQCYCKPISVYGKDDWYFELIDEGFTVIQVPPETDEQDLST